MPGMLVIERDGGMTISFGAATCNAFDRVIRIVNIVVVYERYIDWDFEIRYTNGVWRYYMQTIYLEIC